MILGPPIVIKGSKGRGERRKEMGRGGERVLAIKNSTRNTICDEEWRGRKKTSKKNLH